MNPNGPGDELDALRRRNPHPSCEGPYREAPLDPRAERDLAALVSGATATRPVLGLDRRRRSWASVAVTVPVALLLVCAVALTALVLTPQSPGVTAAGPGAGQVGPAERGTSGAAALVLEQMAAVAAERPPLAPREDQFAYVRTLVSSNTGPLGGRAEPGALHEREDWLAQRAGVDGLIIEEGQAWVMSSASEEDPVGPPPPNTYAAMAQLPTDPAALLQVLRDDAAAFGYDDLDHGAFSLAGEWLATGMAPPEVVAALYRATALLPGVEVVPGAVDAAGRSGTGLSFEDHRSRTRREWVVDEATSTYLGTSAYLIGDTTAGQAGLRTNTSAVLARGVADAAGAPPVRVAAVP